MDDDTRYALFKFQIIAPVLNDSQLNRLSYFKEMAQKEYDVPFTDQKKFKPATFKKWLFLYRKFGLEALKPNQRSDKGKTRVINESLAENIKGLLLKYDFKTVANLYVYLIREKIISPSDFTYATLNTYIRKNNLFNPDLNKKPRKAYEVERINDLWIADFMFGPYVYTGKTKVRTYLCAIIDDFSRVIVSGVFFDNQSTLVLEQTLKNAILTFGIPKKFYCDNGKVFSSGYLDMISARLGFILIHSKPYDAPSRGKIERFFRTVRDKFLVDFKIFSSKYSATLDFLNQSFCGWLNQEYNCKIHSSIDCTPLDRYFKDAETTCVRKMQAHQIQPIFYHTIYRKVKNDSTIGYNNILFELPPKYIGKKVEIRFNPSEDNQLFLFEDNKQVLELKLLNKHDNSKFPIRFNREDKFV